MKLPLWLIGSLFLVGLLAALLFRARVVARENGLRVDSLVAVVDSTRLEAGVWQRRSLQTAIARDSLDRLLHVKPAVKVVTVVRLDTIRVRDTLTVAVDASGERSAVVASRGPGWSLSGSVALPAPPAPGRIDLRVAIDSIPLRLRLGCGDPLGGVRSATVAVEAPPWTRVGLSGVSSVAEVCNPKVAPMPLGGGVPGWLLPATGALGLILGWALHR